MLEQFLLFCAVLIVFIHLYYRYNRGGWLIGQIKGPKQMFLVGNLFDIWMTPEQTFINQIKWRETYGDIFRLCALHYRAVYFYKPEDIETILSSTKYIEKNFPYIFLNSWLREGLLTSMGKKWHHRRKLLTPAFHFVILKKFFGTMCEHTEDLMESIGAEVDKDKTDLVPLISTQALRVICETAMGIEVRKENNKSFTNKYFEALPFVRDCVMHRVNRIWLFADFTYKLTPTFRKEKKALKGLHEFTTNVIQERRKVREHSNDSMYYDTDEMYGSKTKMAMLDVLLAEEKKGNIDEIGIREEVDTFAFEGHDTVSMALSFMIMRIANEPHIQESIYKELQSIYGDSKRVLTHEELSQLKYLECCIKESLRLYPSVAFMARYITEETVIGGQIIPKNTFVHFNMFDIHRNPEMFPEPEKFIPERFLPENIVKLHPFSYIPFSAGPRNCIGQKFAMMEMKTVMASLLWRYRLEPVTKPEDLVFKSDIVLRTNHPLYVKFRHRQ